MPQGMWRMILGIIGLAIAFVMFPIVLTGTSEITGHANINNFTGLSSVANIGPLIIFVGLIFGSGFMAYTGYKQWR